jgi:NADH dehydrogenase
MPETVQVPEPNVLILGAGFGGFALARKLRRDASAHRLRLTVVEPQQYFTYKPLLPEVAGGETAARDALVPLRRTLGHADIVAGSVESVDIDARLAMVRSLDGTERQIDFDHVVYALGAVSRTLPIPGLAENAIGFSSVEEAVYLRDHVLDRVRFAAATPGPAERARALTFVFSGGGYTGVEAIAELQLLAETALRRYPELEGEPMTWLLVEAAGRIAAELTPKLSEWTLELLRHRGITVLLHTEITSCEHGIVQLDNGDSHPCDTLVWVAGVTPNPVLGKVALPRGKKGHLQCNPRLQVVHDDGTAIEGMWALGDAAQVPDQAASVQSAYYAPNAQNAVRQAATLAHNIRSTISGAELRDYRHRNLGTLASYGGHKGAAVLRGVPLHGIAAWIVDKVYHAIALPSFPQRLRLILGWVANALTPRDAMSTSAVRDPRRRFEQAAAEQQRPEP